MNPANVWDIYSRIIGAKKMRCEFCNGRGKNSTWEQPEDGVEIYCQTPCPECNGTGIADCCNGMTADQCVDNEWPDNPAEVDTFERKK